MQGLQAFLAAHMKNIVALQTSMSTSGTDIRDKRLNGERNISHLVALTANLVFMFLQVDLYLQRSYVMEAPHRTMVGLRDVMPLLQ